MEADNRMVIFMCNPITGNSEKNLEKRNRIQNCSIRVAGLVPFRSCRPSLGYRNIPCRILAEGCICHRLYSDHLRGSLVMAG